jgi:hypothetical protein
MAAAAKNVIKCHCKDQKAPHFHNESNGKNVDEALNVLWDDA